MTNEGDRSWGASEHAVTIPGVSGSLTIGTTEWDGDTEFLTVQYGEDPYDTVDFDPAGEDELIDALVRRRETRRKRAILGDVVPMASVHPRRGMTG